MKEIDNTPIEDLNIDWGNPDGTGKKAKSLEQVQAFLKKKLNEGYKFTGIAHTVDKVGTLTGEEKIFRIITEEGNYSNYGVGDVTELSIIRSDGGTWMIQNLGVPLYSVNSLGNVKYLQGYITGNVSENAVISANINYFYVKIPVCKGDIYIYHTDMHVSGKIHAAYTIDDNNSILQTFNDLNSEITISDGVKYLILNGYTKDKCFYYKKNNLTSLFGEIPTLKTDVNTLKTDVNTLKTDVNTLKTDVDILKEDVGVNMFIDSIVYNPNKSNRQTSMTCNFSSSSTEVQFDVNPVIMTLDGRFFYLFPKDSTSDDWKLTFTAYQIVYIDASVLPSQTSWSNPAYMPADSIKKASILQNFNKAKNSIILAASTDSTNGSLFDIGCIGHYYYNTPTLKKDVNTLKTDTTTLKTDVGTLKTDVNTLKTDTATLKTDVGTLKADAGVNMFIDSIVYNPNKSNRRTSMTCNFTTSSTEVQFDANPVIMTLDGRLFYLFPKDSTSDDWKLTFASYQIVYIDASVLPSQTSWVSPAYMPADSIKKASILQNFNKAKNSIILAASTDSTNGSLFDIGCIGHYYYNTPTLKKDVNTLKKDVNTLKEDVDTLETTVGDLKTYVDSLVVTPSSVRDHFPIIPSNYGILKEKCPNFYDAFKNKSKDVTIVLTGTSLSQGNLYATSKENPSEYPPLLHTHDLAGNLFDILINYWGGQKYRRYDHTDLVYSQSDWTVINSLVIDGVQMWDDRGVYKNGMTKTTTSPNANVSFVIPSDAWRFNFIYRTDQLGGNCSINVQDGIGKLEVYNGSEWVEANGFTFSMLESPATATKGNTCFQKRLNMRCKDKASSFNSIGQEKHVTISKGADNTNFNVVGVEWSPREFMFTLINGSRGSHNWGYNNGLNLEVYQDLDVWAFKPDLILAEVTAINWGASNAEFRTRDPEYFVNLAKRAYFNEFDDNPDSLYEKSNKWTDCEVIFYGDTLGAGGTIFDPCWDENGNATFATVAQGNNAGRVINNFEHYDAVDAYMMSKDKLFIPVTRTFKKVCESYWGNYRAGFRSSSANGATLSTDGTHLNDNGAALWTRLISYVFEGL